MHLSVTGDEWPLFPLCVNSHRGAGSIPAISAIWQMLRFFRVEHCYSNRRRLPFIGIKGVGGIVATWEATIEKSHAAFYTAHRAPATEAYGDFFKTRETREIHSPPWLPARTSRTACSLSRAPASASCVEAGASSFFRDILNLCKASQEATIQTVRASSGSLNSWISTGPNARAGDVKDWYVTVVWLQNSEALTT